MTVKWIAAPKEGFLLKEGFRNLGGIFSIKPNKANEGNRWLAWRMDFPSGTKFKSKKLAMQWVEDLNWYGRVGDRKNKEE